MSDRGTKKDNDQHAGFASFLETMRPHTPHNPAAAFAVRQLRWVLPAAALALTVLVLIWPQLERDGTYDLVRNAGQTTSMQPAQTNLSNAVFETFDENNRPVRITADQAVQAQNSENLIRLTNPQADLLDESGRPLNVRSLNGTYDRVQERLLLQKQVRIIYDSGTFIDSEEMRLDAKNRNIFSSKPVKVVRDNSELTADGVTGSMEEKRLEFTGPAKLVIRPATQNNAGDAQ